MSMSPGKEAFPPLQSDRPIKKPRGGIARQACENCRTRKSRCDEQLPCRLCRTLGVTCSYAERKHTVSEITLSALGELLTKVADNVNRLEDKVESLSSRLSYPVVSQAISHLGALSQTSPTRFEHFDLRPTSSPQDTRQSINTSNPHGQLTFSAHQKIQWPGIKSLLPAEVAFQYPRSYPAQLELNRPSFAGPMPADVRSRETDWLAALSMSELKELPNAYFDTFNRIYPLLDRDHFFAETLSHVLCEGFDESPETCLVLNVMAIGCLGLQSYRDGGFESASYPIRNNSTCDTASARDLSAALFEEGLSRSGTCLTRHDLTSCQYYMTAAVFFLQTLRPADMWMMLNRGASLLTALLHYPANNDDWSTDIRSRVFWSSVMLEVVVAQEFEYSHSRLKEWEESTPLPRFVPYPHSRSRSSNTGRDDSHYQYHFLAQVAHRIILSRIREELFNTNPSVALATELRHQIEQWRSNLPLPMPSKDHFAQLQSFTCPADVIATALLRQRYCVGIYHLGRPFCYKAIHQPETVTDSELEICAEALQMAAEWPMAAEVPRAMPTFMPLSLFVAGQMLGQLLILYAFQHSPDERVRASVPSNNSQIVEMMLDYLTTLESESPTIAMDLQLLRMLYERQAHT